MHPIATAPVPITLEALAVAETARELAQLLPLVADRLDRGAAGHLHYRLRRALAELEAAAELAGGETDPLLLAG